MVQAPIKFTFDTKKFKKDSDKFDGRLTLGISIGLVQAAELMNNEIRTKKLGPNFYNKRLNKSILKNAKGKKGVNKKLAGMIFGMAVSIAQKEGHKDFSRGKISRGSGWARVLKLIHSMPVVRPRKPQVLWGQSGKLRKAQSFAVRAKGQKASGKRTTIIRLGKALAMVALHNAVDYGKQYEESFGKRRDRSFMRPTIIKWLANGALLQVVDKAVSTQLKKLEKV